jgi:hypothetical protein
MKKVVVQFEIDVPEEAIRLAEERESVLGMWRHGEKMRDLLRDIYDAEYHAGLIDAAEHTYLLEQCASQFTEQGIIEQYDAQITKIIDDAVNSCILQPGEIAVNTAHLESIYDQIMDSILPEPTVDDLRPSNYRWGPNS